MCIRHTQFFECPSREGPVKQHRIKSNILCSDNFPCQESHWEHRHSYYRYMCPSCSGEPAEVPHEKPYQEHWVRNVAQFEGWAQNYIQSLSNAVSLWIWGRRSTPASFIPTHEMVQMYPTFFYERRCKEEGHRPSSCSCEANGPIAFLYNPAMALRRHLTNETALAFEWEPHLQSPQAREAFADVHRSLTAMCRNGNHYFKDGIARQPFFSTQAVDRRRQTLTRVIQRAWQNVEEGLKTNAEANGANWTDAHTLMESQALRRKNLIRFMGEIMLYENGVSTAKFCLATEMLAQIIQLPQWRTQSGVLALENLANMVSRTILPTRPEEPLRELIAQTTSYFSSKRELWTQEMRAYSVKRMLFEKSTTIIDGASLRGSEGEEGRDECGICYVQYWESPSVPSATASPTMAQKTWPGRLQSQSGSAESNISNQIRRLRWEGDENDPQGGHRGFKVRHSGFGISDHGEPAVRINECGHVFGRSCLFRNWVTEANAANQRPACPMCRTEPPDPVYQLVESTLGIRATAYAGWHMPTFLWSLVGR